jgi:hypothetical protein
MSASSSRRRQLASFEKPARAPMGTTGQPKGPARTDREVDIILGRKRLAAYLEHEGEMFAARALRALRTKRLVLVGAAVVLALVVLAYFIG